MYPEEFGCCSFFTRCYVAIFHCKCNETMLPISIGPTKRTLREFKEDMQHQYTRFTQASQVLAYWPITVGFILGWLGVIQSNVVTKHNSLHIAKSFGAAQAFIGLASTLAVGIASQIKSRSETRLRDCIDEGINAGYLQAKDKNDILRKLGLQAKSSQKSSDEAEGDTDDFFEDNNLQQQGDESNRPPAPPTFATRAKNMLA